METKSKGTKKGFFFPSDIEKRLKNGSQERYDCQLSRLKGMKCDDKKIQADSFLPAMVYSIQTVSFQ